MVKCVLCEKTNFETISTKVRDSKKHKIIKCKNCTHIQLYPLQSIKEYKKFYDENRQIKNIKFDFKIEKLEKKSEFDVQRRLKIVKKNSKKNDKILEIGSGNGFLLKKLFNLGYDIIGIEISKERRLISKKLSNAPVLNCEISNARNHLGKFDKIILFQVLEHITEPEKFLKKLYKLLNKKGTIIIEVPNVEDFQLSLNQSYQSWFWQKAHVNYFSKKTLSRTVKKAGFKNIKINGIQRYSIENMFNWKIMNNPQSIEPTYELKSEYSWIEKNYKKYLEKNLVCDTLMVMAKKCQ